MTNCKIRVIVITENVPEDKKTKLIEHIAQNIKMYSCVLDCDLEVSASP